MVAVATDLKLDLGCGQNKRGGYTGVDLAAVPGVDVVHDLRVTPWPFDDESVAEVFCQQFLEHLTGAERIVFMNELWRVMKTGATAQIITPYYTSMRAVQDPTHAWPPICEASFLYWNREWRETNRLSHYPITCDFDFAYGYALPPEWAARNQETQSYAVAHYLNVALDLHVTLTKRA